MFSKACEYGIRAAIYISHQSQAGNRVSLKEVAAAIDSPVAFTAKILQSLAKSKIIISTRGQTGGYEIDKEKYATIKLSQIVEAIDGEAIFTSCGLGLRECNAAKPCPLHFQFKAIRDDLQRMLQNTTLLQLAQGLHAGTAFLKQ